MSRGTQRAPRSTFGEVLALPSPQGVRLASRPQQVIPNASDLTPTADPFAGSYAIESMTDDIQAAAESPIDRIEDMGGAAPAIGRGFHKGEIQAPGAQDAPEISEWGGVVLGCNKCVAHAAGHIKSSGAG